MLEIGKGPRFVTLLSVLLLINVPSVWVVVVASIVTVDVRVLRVGVVLVPAVENAAFRLVDVVASSDVVVETLVGSDRSVVVVTGTDTEIGKGPGFVTLLPALLLINVPSVWLVAVASIVTVDLRVLCVGVSLVAAVENAAFRPVDVAV